MPLKHIFLDIRWLTADFFEWSVSFIYIHCIYQHETLPLECKDNW